MRVLLTGAFGNVGLGALDALIEKGYKIRATDIKTRKNLRLSNKYKNKAEIIWCDIRNHEEVVKLVEGQDVVIHVAAIIPPLADEKPLMAESINVGGTFNIIRAMEKQAERAKLIYTSSVAIYGDRRESPLIKPTDPPNPNSDDEYAKQKLRCEGLIKQSELQWAIFRLTYIVCPDHIEMDPLMFRMPLETSIEICHTKDVGLALANAVVNDKIWYEIMHFAGGDKCRIVYKEYIERMMEIFGLGRDFLPDEAFGKENFHCGFMTTDDSQSILKYQRNTLNSFYNEMKEKFRFQRYMMRILKPLIRIYLLGKSPYYKAFLKKQKS